MSTFLSYVLYLVRHGTWTAIFFHMSSIQFVMGHRQEYLFYMSSLSYYMIKGSKGIIDACLQIDVYLSDLTSHK